MVYPLDNYGLSPTYFCVSDVSISILTLSIFNVIDLVEGPPLQSELLISGFSYGEIPLQVRAFTYDQYRDSGYDLTDDINPRVIPEAAADGKYMLIVRIHCTSN